MGRLRLSEDDLLWELRRVGVDEVSTERWLDGAVNGVVWWNNGYCSRSLLWPYLTLNLSALWTWVLDELWLSDELVSVSVWVNLARMLNYWDNMVWESWGLGNEISLVLRNVDISTLNVTGSQVIAGCGNVGQWNSLKFGISELGCEVLLGLNQILLLEGGDLLRGKLWDFLSSLWSLSWLRRSLGSSLVRVPLDVLQFHL